MKKVLYISNIAVPYRVVFFNELAKHCDLTVLYERKESSNRNASWENSEQVHFQAKYLDGIRIKNENSFSLKILLYLFASYDEIVIGCYNSPVQMFSVVILRLLRKPYFLSLDGEQFIKGNGIKSKLKKFFMRGAKHYLTAGEKDAKTLQDAIGVTNVAPYYFSSLTSDELAAREEKARAAKRNQMVLVVGQYFDYKGLDIAVKAAKMDPSISYKFVGTGMRTELFVETELLQKVPNIEVIPFLSKKDLEEEYQKSAMLVLPTRQECWGLVINEAASYGMPIVSTWGSGAAVEFLADKYATSLILPGDATDLYQKIKMMQEKDTSVFTQYLLEKSKRYSIEHMVRQHCKILSL